MFCEKCDKEVHLHLNEVILQESPNELFICVSCGNSLQSIQSNKNVITRKYSWWKYDDEYISGWQYFGRSFVGILLMIILVGLYLISVTAYKRSKSLGHSQTSCNLWAIWGFLLLPLAFTPISFLTNTIPHWYLWFSNGTGKSYSNNKEYQ